MVLLGVGNPLRGDDAVAHELAASLAGLNGARFQAHATGTAIENATHYVRKASGGLLLIVDAVFDETLDEGAWDFIPAARLDTFCHTTHSIPLSLLISIWQQEIPDLEIHFLGISIRNNAERAPVSPAVLASLESLRSLIEAVPGYSVPCTTNVPG